MANPFVLGRDRDAYGVARGPAELSYGNGFAETEIAIAELLSLAGSAKKLYREDATLGWQLFSPAPDYGVIAANVGCLIGTSAGEIIFWRGIVGSEWAHYDPTTGIWTYKAKAGTGGFSGVLATGIELGGVLYAADSNGNGVKYASGAWSNVTPGGAKTSSSKIVALGTELWMAGATPGGGAYLWQSTDGGATWTNRTTDFRTAVGVAAGAAYYTDIAVANGGTKLFIALNNETTGHCYVGSWNGAVFAPVGAVDPGGVLWGFNLWANSDTDVWLLGTTATQTRLARWTGSWAAVNTHALPAMYPLYNLCRSLCGHGSTIAALLDQHPGDPATEVYESHNATTFAAATLPDANVPSGLGVRTQIMPNTYGGQLAEVFAKE